MSLKTERSFDGNELVGEELSPNEIAKWFEDEKEASFKLRGGKRSYEYHEMNRLFGFERLPDRTFSRALSFGCGDGDGDGAPVHPGRPGSNHNFGTF